MKHGMVLRLVNKARRELGMRSLDVLPKGEIKEALHCPLANSMTNGCRAEVDSNSVYFIGKRRRIYAETVAFAWKQSPDHSNLRKSKVSLPKVLQKFVEGFDEKRYPELVAQD